MHSTHSTPVAPTVGGTARSWGPAGAAGLVYAGAEAHASQGPAHAPMIPAAVPVAPSSGELECSYTV